jgi:hypothetical protein
MTSSARTALIETLSAFRATLDEALVRDATPEGDFLRKGITVAAFNVLETFVASRTEELSGVLNAGSLQFIDFSRPFPAKGDREPYSRCR